MYIYSLKNRPYTVRIITKESTHTNRPPIRVTAHRGIDSKNPQFSIADTISEADFEKGYVIVKKGKKVFNKIIIE